ncbi:MAG: hypothetical protein KIT84_13100 [Labilithrix sp.]|nr:hypothetical protein [Labilithrix sp.]MCW5811953.1 hypothetical protein [Labilithrix sp.]
MSGEYRDDLSAAHARIAELEEKVRALQEEAAPKPLTPDGRFPELEEKVALLRRRAHEGNHARRRTILSLVGAIFPLLGMMFSFLHLPLVAAVCSVVFITFIVLNLSLAHTFKTAKKELAEAEAKLANALRIADLESRLAAKNVRVAAADEPLATADIDTDTAAEPMRAAR